MQNAAKCAELHRSRRRCSAHAPVTQVLWRRPLGDIRIEVLAIRYDT